MAGVTSTATWLVDTSALARIAVPEVGRVLRPLIDAGRVAVSTATLLEIGYSARSIAEHESTQQTVLRHLQFVYGSPRSERRAIDVQRELMTRGHHRAVKLPDLLVAAIGEAEGLTVLHHDADFDRIADVTDQPTTWVVEPDAIP